MDAPIADMPTYEFPALPQGDSNHLQPSTVALMDGSTSSSGSHFWDWHSYVIMFFLIVIGYHFWAFRALYRRTYEEMARAIRNRVFNAEISVGLTIRTQDRSETVSVVLTDLLPPAEQRVLEIGSEAVAVAVEDDHFHDCLE